MATWTEPSYNRDDREKVVHPPYPQRTQRSSSSEERINGKIVIYHWTRNVSSSGDETYVTELVSQQHMRELCRVRNVIQINPIHERLLRFRRHGRGIGGRSQRRRGLHAVVVKVTGNEAWTGHWGPHEAAVAVGWGGTGAAMLRRLQQMLLLHLL